MPSFIDVVNGANADASTIQQVVDALKGTAGKGIPLSPTAVNDAINFALAVKNNDAGASKAAIFYKADGSVLLQVDKNGVIVSPDGVAGAAPVATTTGTQTLTNKILTSPHMTGAVLDSGGLTGQPAARVTHNAAQSIATGTWTSVAFNTERYDTDAIHDTVTNNSRLTCKTAGKYAVKANVQIQPSATGTRWIRIIANSASVYAEWNVVSIGAGNSTILQLSTDIALAVNDYVEVQVFQDSGGALNAEVAASFSPEFMMSLVA